MIDDLFEWTIVALLLVAGLLLFAEPADADTCAKVVGGKIVTIEGGKSLDACLGSEKDKDGNPIWRPYVKMDRPTFDPVTQHAPIQSTVIGSDQVTLTWSTPAAKTQAEMDAEAAAQKDSIAEGINKAVFEALCHLKNEVRTKVESLPAWSKSQCLTAFRALLD